MHFFEVTHRKDKRRFCTPQVAVHRLFDWFLYLVIFLNVVAICVEMSLLSKAECRRDYYRQYHNTFMIINYVFIVIYTLEAFIKVRHVLSKEV